MSKNLSLKIKMRGTLPPKTTRVIYHIHIITFHKFLDALKNVIQFINIGDPNFT